MPVSQNCKTQCQNLMNLFIILLLQYLSYYSKTVKMSLGEGLLSHNSLNQIYNPYQNPPNILRAQQHQQATQVGIDPTEDSQSYKTCPCCHNIIQKQPLPLTCNQDQLLFLGLGYPLLFKLTRYFGMIILIVFIISGSGFYFLVTLSCIQKCIYFLRVPIINLQISGKDSAMLADFIHVITALIMLFLVIYIKSRLMKDISYYEQKIISPQQYTIMIQNLPEDENINQQKIMDWCKDIFGYKPILINFAYNVNQLLDSLEQRQFLTIRRNRLLIKKKQAERDKQQNQKYILISQDIKQIQQRILKYDHIIDHYKNKHSSVNCRKIGTVFLTFSQQKHVIEILNKYQTSIIQIILRRSINQYRNKTIKYQDIPISVHKAPNPTQIIWQNLNYSSIRYVMLQIIIIVTILIVMYIAFQIQIKFTVLSYQFRQQARQNNNETNLFLFLQSVFLCVGIMLFNFILRIIIKQLINLKKHYSYSTFQSSFCFYYSLIYIFNACFMIYIVHIRHSKNQKNQQIPLTQRDQVLLYDIHLVMLINAFSQPIYKLIDPMMWGRVIWRRHIASLPKQQNPYTQAYANRIWQGYQISNADNYQYIYRNLIVTVWFAHSAPLGVFFSLLGLATDFWINKYMLLRHYKKPIQISKIIAIPMIKSLHLIPLIYLCGMLQFTYKVADSTNLLQFLLQFFDYGVTILFILFTTWAYFYLKTPQQPIISSAKYDQVQSMFQTNYDNQNPINKIKQQDKINYFGSFRKNGLRDRDSKIVKQLMLINKKSTDQSMLYENLQSNSLKIKRGKTWKKLQTMDISQQYFNEQKNKNKKNAIIHNNQRSSDSSNQNSDQKY